MDLDFATLIVGLLGGTGIVGIAQIVYDRYWENKTRVIQYYREMVFTPDLFAILRTHQVAFGILKGFETCRRLNSTYPIVGPNGERVDAQPTDFKKIVDLLDTVGKQRVDAINKSMNSGAWFLLPQKLYKMISSGFESPFTILQEPNAERRFTMLETYGKTIEAAMTIARETLGLERPAPEPI